MADPVIYFIFEEVGTLIFVSWFLFVASPKPNCPDVFKPVPYKIPSSFITNVLYPSIVISTISFPKTDFNDGFPLCSSCP